MIRIVTDSAADLTAAELSLPGIFVVPMSVTFADGTTQLDDGTMTKDEFFVRLAEDSKLPRTSQPSPASFIQVYEDAAAAGDEVLVITIGQKLSGTYQCAHLAAADVGLLAHIVDSEAASQAEALLVREAVRLRDEEGLTAEEIAAVLERRRAMAAELVPHKGPAVKGNIVHIDYEGLLEGKPFNGGTAQNQTLQLGSGRMIPGFEEGILGHKGGEAVDIFVTFPARYHVKDLAGKPVVFKIKLHDVCVRQLPALNSDFARKAANVDTMDEFRAQIRQQLHDSKHAAALNRAKDAILTQLAAAAEGELPSVLVESAYQQEMEQIQQQLQMQRLSLDRYLSQIHQTRESFTAAVRTAAEKNTRARMALLQIAQNEDLVPTEEDIDKTLSERAERTKKTLEEVKAASNVEAIRRNEGIRRAADYVIEHSTIEEK